MEELGQSQKREAITWIIGLPILYLLIVKSFAIDAPNPDSFVEVSSFAKEMPKLGIFAIFASILALVQAIDGKQVISKGRTWAILTLVVFAIIPYIENYFRHQADFQSREGNAQEQLRTLREQHEIRGWDVEKLQEQNARLTKQVESLTKEIETLKGENQPQGY